MAGFCGKVFDSTKIHAKPNNVQKMKFFIWSNPQFPADLVTFSEEIFNEKHIWAVKEILGFSLVTL